MEATNRLGIRHWLAAFSVALAGLMLLSPIARAGVVIDGTPGTAGCPPIADKPGAIPEVNYTGMQHITYCYGPINIAPGQNIIKLRTAIDTSNQKLWPQVPGYITRFDPEFTYTDGSVPRVDVLHLHHAVWAVNGNPQFAAGEEKTIQQLPSGFGWRSVPGDTWYLNDMLHDLLAQNSQVYLVWRIDFVPDTLPNSSPNPAAATMKTVTTKWMDVAGDPSLYPVFDALRSDGQNGTYTFPDQAPAADRSPCGAVGGEASWAPGQHGCLGAAQSWTVPGNHPQTLIGTAGHLHPGGLYTTLKDKRGANPANTIFTSDAHYYEPAGEVSWDVAMKGTPADWLVQVQPGDKVSVHATYDTTRADWYEVMGIMPVAVYDGTVSGSHDAQAPGCTAPNVPAGCIPENGVETHGHLAENDNHGGDPTGAANPFSLPSAPVPGRTIGIQSFAYQSNPSAGLSIPTIEPGQSLTYQNLDAVPAVNAFHTITACKDPCTGKTGIAYPIANGPVTFDSGELGFNGNQGSIGGAPASGTDTWKTPSDLPAGTYTFFCRIHPFMRGSFRVEKQPKPTQKLRAKKKQSIRSAAVTVKVDKAATVKLGARVKGAGAGSSRASRVLAEALDAKRSTASVRAGVSKKIRLRFTKAALKKIRAAGNGRWKVVVTGTATDGYGEVATSKARFRLSA
jgi:plastocyanin